MRLNNSDKLAAFGLVTVLSLGLSYCSQDPEQAVSDALQLTITALSNQPHLISGGDVLVEVTASRDIELLQFSVNGSSVDAAIEKMGDQAGRPHSYRALVSDLSIGDNEIVVAAGDAVTELSISNYPITGPIISGEQQQPYFCLNQLATDQDDNKPQFAIGNGEFLEAADTDANCSLPTSVDYVYHSTNSELGFLALADPDSKPADLEYVTTIEEVEVPYIVRLETGTINRAIYQIALLHDPDHADLSGLHPSPSWNERLVYTFGGGCEPGYFQGNSTAGVLRDTMLRRGYAVASSTLNVNAQGGCNDVISAETAMMVKEHFIEAYGLPRYTIGSGGSGGAMQQLLIAGAYPGILDGLMPAMTFADAVSYFTDAQECASLLRDYVADPELGLDDATKAALGGWSMWSVCDQSLGQRPKRIGPDDCSAQIPESARYHPQTNPEGARCSIYDGMRNIFGEKAYPDIGLSREFARAPHDNVGVQYGLASLNQGLIDKEQFLHLNENIGGWDIDVNPQNARTEADDDALRIAYQTGRVTTGGAGLAQVPIIDDRTYLDDIGDFHASVYSFITRARLQRDNGHADNYVMRRHGRDISLADDNLALMDQWLANIQADTQSDTHTDTTAGNKLEKIVRSRPVDLQDDCYAVNGERIIESPVFNMDRLFDNTEGTCNKLFTPHAGLRLVAGGPLTNDVLKCQLKPIDYADYKVTFTEEEQRRLQSVFAGGVCDWSKPGVHQQLNQTWLSFGPSPVNRYDEK